MVVSLAKEAFSHLRLIEISISNTHLSEVGTLELILIKWAILERSRTQSRRMRVFSPDCKKYVAKFIRKKKLTGDDSVD